MQGLGVIFLHRHFEEHIRLFNVLETQLPALHHILKLAEMLLNFLGLGQIIPERWL